MKDKYLLLLLLLLISCNQRVTDSDGDTDPPKTPLVETVGTDQTFEIASWNIEWFPKTSSTKENLKLLIQQLEIDLIGVQEIASISAFNSLLSNLPGWKGVLSDDKYSDGSYQKTGLIFNASVVSVSNVHSIFTDNHYAFPRAPLAAFVEIKDADGTKFDFNVIVLHLKAFGGEENIERRKAACVALEEFVKNEISAGADPDFIVLGDWNDQLKVEGDNNIFRTFLDKQDNYSFLTYPLNNQYSYISNSYKSLIDHVLITKDARVEYGTGETKVLYLDKQYINYPAQISDHRPVVSIFKGFTLNP